MSKLLINFLQNFWLILFLFFVTSKILFAYPQLQNYNPSMGGISNGHYYKQSQQFENGPTEPIMPINSFINERENLNYRGGFVDGSFQRAQIHPYMSSSNPFAQQQFIKRGMEPSTQNEFFFNQR